MEQFKIENIPSQEEEKEEVVATPESSVEGPEDEATLYNNFKEAMAEQDRITDEMDKVFETTPDQAEAAKIIHTKWVPLMKEAAAKTNEAIAKWREAMEKSQEA